MKNVPNTIMTRQEQALKLLKGLIENIDEGELAEFIYSKWLGEEESREWVDKAKKVVGVD